MSQAKPLFGVGLRNEHYVHLESSPKTEVDFFEVITENYLDSEGRPKEVLLKIREEYPIHLHGVSMNIAAHSELSMSYLKKLKDLIDEIQPALVSDHLCWTGLAATNIHNLLPFPYTDETLDFISNKIEIVQNYLEREMTFENLSAYFDYETSGYTEWDFLQKLSDRTGCKILLDINNVYVNSQNQKFNAEDFLKGIKADSVTQMHLAGFSNLGDFLFDTHSNPVFPEVWELYRTAVQKFKNIPTLIEWDEAIPEFVILEAEMLKAKRIQIELGLLQ